MQATDSKNQPNQIFSIYDFYYDKCIDAICKLPLDFQLKEFFGAKIILLDFCGMYAVLSNKFKNYEIYLIENLDEDVLKELNEIISSYDIVYIFRYLLQEVNLHFSHIEIIFNKGNISEVNYNIASK